MSPLNGVPQPGRFPMKKVGYSGSGRGGRSCLLTIVGLLGSAWILDLVLAGSQVAS